MASVSNPRKRLATPRGFLPLQIRALFVTGKTRASGWLADAFAADSASDVSLEEAAGMASGLARLRDDLFDVVLVSHEDGLDALDFLDALRGGGGDQQAIVVLGEQREQELAAFCYEAGADAYVCLHTATTRALLWLISRAIERVRLVAENQRLEQTKRRRLQTEQDEARSILSQQRAMLATIIDAQQRQLPNDQPCGTDTRELSRELTARYQQLLRAYIVMGVGNLAAEITQFVDQIAARGLTLRRVMEFHLSVLEDLLDGLGNRSTRHAMSRADMLLLEVMINFADRSHSGIQPNEANR